MERRRPPLSTAVTRTSCRPRRTRGSSCLHRTRCPRQRHCARSRRPPSIDTMILRTRRSSDARPCNLVLCRSTSPSRRGRVIDTRGRLDPANASSERRRRRSRPLPRQDKPASSSEVPLMNRVGRSSRPFGQRLRRPPTFVSGGRGAWNVGGSEGRAPGSRSRSLRRDGERIWLRFRAEKVGNLAHTHTRVSAVSITP